MVEMNNVVRDFLTAASLKEPETVPAVIWGVALWYTKKLGIKARDYYQSLELKLEVQIKLQEQFPDALMLPGIWPDFGVAAEASAFGCPIVWDENQAPSARPAITDIRQVLKFKNIDMKTSGLLPDVLKTHEYFLDKIPKHFIDDYGYLDGSVFLLGPLETAALIRGYVDFLLDLLDQPVLVHSLLRIITDKQIEWLQYLETRIGKLKRLFLADHFPTQISPEHFEEFFLPYIKKIFEAFPYAITLWHNEGEVSHIIDRVPELKCNIFHFGTDAAETKKVLGGKVCLMGNIDPVMHMQSSSAQQVHDECLRVLTQAAPGGGFILCAAGGYGVDTLDENVYSMLNSVKEYSMTIRQRYAR
jgi:uroporphyrinogen decarboxylase